MKPGCWELSPQFQTTRRGDEPAGPVSGRQRSRHHRTVLFLTRDGDALLEAADLLLLWGRGWAERVIAPPKPRHIAAQQIPALCLQEHRAGGPGRSGGTGSHRSTAVPTRSCAI